MDDVGDTPRLAGGQLSMKLQVLRARLKKGGGQPLAGAANSAVAGSQHQQPAASGTLVAPSSPGTSSSDRDGRLKPPPAQRRQLQPARQVVAKAVQSAQQRLLRGVRAATSSVRVQSPQAELALGTAFATVPSSGSPSGPAGGTSASSTVAGVTGSSSVGGGRDFDAPMSFEELMRRKRERGQQQQEVSATVAGAVPTANEGATHSPADPSQRRQLAHSSEGVQHQQQAKAEIGHVQSSLQQAAVVNSNAVPKILPTTPPGTIRSVQSRDQQPLVVPKVAAMRQVTDPQKSQLQRQKQEAPCLQRGAEARPSPPAVKASGETRTQSSVVEAKVPASRLASGLPAPKQHQNRVLIETAGVGEPSTRSQGVVPSVSLAAGATGAAIQVKVPAASVPKVCAPKAALQSGREVLLSREVLPPARASEKPPTSTLQVVGSTSSPSGIRTSSGQGSRSLAPVVQNQPPVQQVVCPKGVAPKATTASHPQQRPDTASALPAATAPTLTVSRSGAPPPGGTKACAPVKGIPSNLENNEQNVLCDRLALEQTAFAPLRNPLWPWGCGPPNVLARMLQEIARAADSQMAAAAMDASPAVASAAAASSNRAEATEDHSSCRAVENDTSEESAQHGMRRLSSTETVPSSPFSTVASLLRLVAEQDSNVPTNNISFVKVACESFVGTHPARAPTGQELSRLSPEGQAEALEKFALAVQQELKRCDLQLVEVTGKRLFSASSGESQPLAEEAAVQKRTRTAVAAVSVARA